MAAQLNPEELKEYLGMVVDLEKNLFIQGELKTQMDQKVVDLGHPINYQLPQEPVRTADFDKAKAIRNNILLGLILGIVFGAIAGVVLYLPAVMFFRSYDIFEEEMLFCTIAGAIIGTVAGVYYFHKEKTAAEIAMFNDQTKADEYQKELEKVNHKIAIDTQRVEREQNEKERIQRELPILAGLTAQTTETLQNLYALDVLYPKYRNFVAVCSIYEYLCSGRCTTLTGPDGAYSMYETEVRLDKLITSLDVVVRELQQIKASQYMLYTAVQEGNQTARQILDRTSAVADSVNQIESNQRSYQTEVNQRLGTLETNSTLIAYNTEQIHIQEQYRNRMEYLAGRYGGWMS